MVPGNSEIFVIGDTASFEQDGKPLPGVAQVAMQQGRYAGKLIHGRIAGSTPPGPFSYFDKGTMAVVGKGFAVLQSHKIRVSGFGAWLPWAAVHLQFLATSSLRLTVFLDVLDVSHRSEGFSAHRESPWTSTSEGCRGDPQQVSSGMNKIKKATNEEYCRSALVNKLRHRFGR